MLYIGTRSRIIAVLLSLQSTSVGIRSFVCSFFTFFFFCIFDVLIWIDILFYCSGRVGSIVTNKILAFGDFFIRTTIGSRDTA